MNTYNSTATPVFITWVYSNRQKSHVQLLIASLRTFGGTLNQCPVWIFEANPQNVNCKDLEGENVRLFPLETPSSVKHYLYADKVYACAKAESLASTEVQSLVWLTPECLIIQPPTLFDLGNNYDAAVRPVHIKNVGSPAIEPIDDFWRKVYQAVGVEDIHATVESFIDQKQIRAYFNSAAFAVNPSLGLCQRWYEAFEALVNDKEYQMQACQDEHHQIFLHQAILSALLATMLDAECLRILPPDYVYPYNLHCDVPPERRAAIMNDLVCIYYEGRSLDPGKIDDIEVAEPLRSWLFDHAKGIT
jgi:hypothetical protein